MPKMKKGKHIVIKLCGHLVTWLVEIDPITYQSKVVYENGVKILYLEVEKAIYGMLVVALTWYRQVRKDLEAIGFTFNPYDPCIVKRNAPIAC